MNSRQRQLRTRGTRGFTLLELVLVMLLIVAMLAAAVPSLRGFLGSSRARDAGTQVLALAQLAKARSAAESKIYRLNVDGASYWLSMQEGEVFVPLGTDLGRRFSMPAGMQIEIVPLGNVTVVDRTGISFYPNGRADTGMFRLSGSDGDVTLIASLSPTEPFRVVAPEEVARL